MRAWCGYRDFLIRILYRSCSEKEEEQQKINKNVTKKKIKVRANSVVRATEKFPTNARNRTKILYFMYFIKDKMCGYVVYECVCTVCLHDVRIEHRLRIKCIRYTTVLMV